MNSRESSNSVSRPRATPRTENIIELPKSRLVTNGDKLFIFHRRRLHRVRPTPEGLFRGMCHDVKWLVRLV